MSKRSASELFPRPNAPIPLEFERREFQPIQSDSPPASVFRCFEPISVTPESDSEILVPGTPEPSDYDYLQTEGRQDLDELLEIPNSNTGFEDQRGYFPYGQEEEEEDEEEPEETPTVNLHVTWSGLVDQLQSETESETDDSEATELQGLGDQLQSENDSEATELEDPDPFWDHVRMAHYRMDSEGRLVPDEHPPE
eukprot:gene13619-17265_t